MSLYSPAPAARPFSEDKPTLIVCWWITAFCATFILLRVAGRYIRVEKLFREDKIAAAALLPLFARMALVHVIILYGTNNVDLNGIAFSQRALQQRSIASRLVLLSRILDAATLWTLKAATLEFFRRLRGITREKSSARAMMAMRAVLLATFLAAAISALAECQPFANYWQVSPDPGGQCRQGYANLLTMAICNVITDLLLVLYPIPIIVPSRIPTTRKVFLVALFCLGLVTVIISIYRVPRVLAEDGYQATRSMWASVEILVATAAANTLALASFVQDLGAKKTKFKFDPISPERSRRHTGHEFDNQAVKLGHPVNYESRKQGLFSSSQSKTSLDLRDSKSSGDRDISPSRSLDSLIPRGQQLSPTSRVTRTTEIEVTVVNVGPRVELAQGAPQGVSSPDSTLRHLGQVHTAPASNRGQGRSSTVFLKDMEALPS